MRLARHYIIHGRVQGVGFRYFVERQANVEGIHGWVRNLPDGRVEIHAEGERESLERFEHHIGHGPSRARVDSVDRTDAAVTAHDAGFSVR
ncbi:MAG: acylphosphatase [Vicinamibacterales bacterium]